MTPRAWILAVGTALVVVTNGVILGGVAHNRSGEPESRVTLSQRELGRPWNWYGIKENSGLSLTLQWRVTDPTVESIYGYYGSHGGSPAWLDEKRMAELGFDVERVKKHEARRGMETSDTDCQVLVVLELAGAAWQDAVERARQRLAHQESLRQASPEAKELIAAEKQAREGWSREENENSRLFAIDVGTDLAALRIKYPDRSRYLILKGRLSARTVYRDKKPMVGGTLGELSVRQINVPFAQRGVLEAMPVRAGSVAGKQPAFSAIVAVGQRLEPWIERVTAP